MSHLSHQFRAIFLQKFTFHRSNFRFFKDVKQRYQNRQFQLIQLQTLKARSIHAFGGNSFTQLAI